MFYLALSDAIEYLCYGSTTIVNSVTLTVWGSTSPESDVYRRQTLRSKVDPRTVRANPLFAKPDNSRFIIFYYPNKSRLLGRK